MHAVASAADPEWALELADRLHDLGCVLRRFRQHDTPRRLPGAAREDGLEALIVFGGVWVEHLVAEAGEFLKLGALCLSQLMYHMQRRIEAPYTWACCLHDAAGRQQSGSGREDEGGSHCQRPGFSRQARRLQGTRG
jgi:hypothetical protein